MSTRVWNIFSIVNFENWMFTLLIITGKEETKFCYFSLHSYFEYFSSFVVHIHRCVSSICNIWSLYTKEDLLLSFYGSLFSVKDLESLEKLECYTENERERKSNGCFLKILKYSQFYKLKGIQYSPTNSNVWKIHKQNGIRKKWRNEDKYRMIHV